MPNELTINATIEYDDGIVSQSSQVVNRVVTLSTQRCVKLVQSVGTSEEAINLGDVTTLGYVMFRNLDPTNIIDIKTGTGGSLAARLDPDTNSDGTGGLALLKLAEGMQAPFAIAYTQACRMEIFLIST